MLPRPQSQDKIQETYFAVCVPGEVFRLSNNQTGAASRPASRNARQRTFFFRRPSLEVAWSLAGRRGRGWRGRGSPHSQSPSRPSSVSQCCLIAINESISSYRAGQVESQPSPSAGMPQEAQSGGGGAAGRGAESLPLVSSPPSSASGTGMECETKSFSS